MKFIKRIKSNMGVSLTDLVVAIIIILLLGATITNMFYKVYYNICMVRLNAIAINSAVNILEDIDRLSYEQVNNDLLTNNNYDLPEFVSISINVQKYSDDNPGKKDIIKIITLNINYKLENNEEKITLKKLKIKEL